MDGLIRFVAEDPIVVAGRDSERVPELQDHLATGEQADQAARLHQLSVDVKYFHPARPLARVKPSSGNPALVFINDWRPEPAASGAGARRFLASVGRKD